MKNSTRVPAVVIGVDSVQGLQAARILAAKKIPVIALARDAHHYACRSRAIRRLVITDTTGEDLIATLRRLGAELSGKAVLFPCEDLSVRLISRSRDLLAPWYHWVLPDPEVVEMLIHKQSFIEYARRNGFNVPRTFFLENHDHALQAASQLRFPCILKPSIKNPQWENHTKLKAFKVHHAQEFLQLFDRWEPYTRSMVVQEWIEGPDANHYSCNCYLDRRSRVVAAFTTRKIRQWPPGTGQGSSGEAFANSTVESETIRLFRKVRFRGLGYLEMKQDARDGKYYVIEPNIGRPTGRSPTAEASGVQLLYTQYCDALGLPLPPVPNNKRKGVKWVHLRHDAQAALHQMRNGELSPRAWWKSLKGPKVFAVFSSRDPLPFFGDLIRAGKLFLSSEERKKRSSRQPVNNTRVKK